MGHRLPVRSPPLLMLVLAGAGLLVLASCTDAQPPAATRPPPPPPIALPALPAEPDQQDWPDLGAGAELIPDGDFEAASDGWRRVDWWKGPAGERNTSVFSRIAVEGGHAQEIACTTYLGGSLQFIRPLPRIHGGSLVQVALRLRGQANTRQIDLALRQHGAPYATYAKRRIDPSDAWMQHRFILALPEQVATDDLALVLTLTGPYRCEVDEVSVRQLPTQAPKPGGMPTPGLPNHSFEAGLTGWSGEARGTGARIAVVPDAQAPHGTQVLAVDTPPGSSFTITSSFVALPYGHPVAVSFHARATAGAALRVGLAGDAYPDITRRATGITASDDAWHPYRVELAPRPTADGRFVLELHSAQGGAWRFDEVRLDGQAPELALGWDSTVPGNAFRRAETPQVTLRAAGAPGTLALHGRVIDAWGREQTRLEAQLTIGADGHGTTPLTLPAPAQGGFRASLWPVGRDSPRLDIVYAVLPALTPLAEAPADSPFGGHALFSDHQLALAERAGFRWLRLHPPLDTKWIEADDGADGFRFATAGAQRAAGRGFRLIGNLHTVPRRFSTAPDKARHDVWASYGPADWAAWERYCRAAVAAFRPWISDWEVWNEPDINFLQVPPGGDRVAIYAEICARTAAALRDEPVTLIGGVIAGHGDFMDRFLAAGGGGSVDVLSFHQYQVGQPALDERRHDLARWATARNRRGEALPVWHTEGSPFAVDSPTWLAASGRRSRYGGGVLEAAAATVRPALWLLAQDVRRHVAYHTMSEAWGGYILRNQFGSLCDTDGSALPAIAAHAAMVALIEGSRPDGVEERQVADQRVLLAHFRQGGRRISAAWTVSGSVPLGELGAGANVLDCMGNPAPGRALASDPLYLIRP